MKITDLALELGVSTYGIKQFIEDFDLDLSECIYPNMDVKSDFLKFARENADFLKKYDEDLQKEKSVKDIAETISQPHKEVEKIITRDKPKLFENGIFKSSISSYNIDHKLGGDYQFVYDYFGDKTNLKHRDFIGYRDLFFYISDMIEPFLNSDQKKQWGISKPAGIVLYGPPGSGKIFWAHKIAEMVGYQFKEVRKHYLGNSFTKNSQVSFNDFLLRMMNEKKVLLFMEDFDEIMGQKTRDKSLYAESEETKEIVLHYIGKFEDEEILMVGSANTVDENDSEILAPGRFDVLVPVFPPNQQERKEIILYYMTEGLDEHSLLMKILTENNAIYLPFWEDISSKMKVFSNTMLIDFTQSLKKRIRNIYQKNPNNKIKINKKLLDSAFRDASAKLTNEYLDLVSDFLRDASINNYEEFQKRIETLKTELETYKVTETPRKAIGFQHNTEKES